MDELVSLVLSSENKEVITYVLSFLALLISISSFYYSTLRGAKIRIAAVERIDFYPEFDSRGEYNGEFEVPVVVINDGGKIGVLSDLHLFVIKPEEYYGKRIRTRQELEELPCAVKNQESIVFRIRKKKPLPIWPEVEYEIKVIGKTTGKEIYSIFKFSLTKKDWKRMSLTKKYIKRL